jgi:hypothetical protein
MKKIITFGIFFSTFVYAQIVQQDEQIFNFSDEFNNSQELILGKNPWATTGLDSALGEEFIPQVPPGQFGVRFQLPPDTSITTVKDIRFGCYWATAFYHLIDLSYVSGSSTITVEWIWGTGDLGELESVYFNDPYTGQNIAWFLWSQGSETFSVPVQLDKIEMYVGYGGTLSTDHFTIYSPNGGEIIDAGSIYLIDYYTTNPFIDIAFSRDSGLSWNIIVEDYLTPGPYGTYEWNVPSIESDNCLIRLGDYPCVYDLSDSVFAITFLPVDLISFTSEVINKNVNLNWTTATETNNQGFEILRSDQNNEWKKIGFVEGHGTTTESQFYSFIDESLQPGKYQYKLKQIDFDGSFEYSKVVEVTIEGPTEFSLSQNYPNPFNPITKIKYIVPPVTLRQAQSDILITLKIYDVLGNEVATLVNEEKPAGEYEVEFNAYRHSGKVRNLPSGIYFYQLKAVNFVETKKMVLMK